jgi:hypothetical protein
LYGNQEKGVTVQLSMLQDQQLLTATKELVQSEREVLTKVLHHLREIERRRLYSDLGCQSLFEYAVRELKYSESQASRRLQAMRLMKEIPQIETAIANGELSLSNISQAQSLFRNQAKESPADPISKAEKIKILKSLKNKTTREGQRTLLSIQPQSVDNRTFEKQRPVTSNATEVKFLMTDELKAQLDRVRTLLGPKALGLGFAELFYVMTTLSTEKLEERKFGKRRVAADKEYAIRTSESVSEVEAVNRIATPARASIKQVISVSSKNPRYVSQAIKHEVWKRDGNRCSHCGSSYNLNIDHIHPVALGGTSSAENLRLLCFSCNQRQAIKAFGLAVVEKCASRAISDIA